MKYLLDSKIDRVTKIFIEYSNIKDYSTFIFRLHVHCGWQEIRIDIRDVLNQTTELFTMPGFLRVYRRMRQKIQKGSPIDIFLDKFEENLEPDERIILEVGDE